MKKLLLIFNEKSGRAQVKEKLYSIVDFYRIQGFIVTLLAIEQIGYLPDLLQEEKFDIIVCAGGDGTLNGVISSCMTVKDRVPIGYLPMGSTNDFARTLGYTDDFEEALQRSCGSSVRLVDIGKFNDRYFVYVAAFGSLTEVSYSTSQSVKNVLGHFAYLLSGIQKITDIKSYQMEIQANEQLIKGEFCMGFIMNSLSIGGFKNPLSDLVELDDGVFEVFLIKMPHGVIEMQQIIADLLSQNIQGSMFQYFQTKHLKIQSQQIKWTLDGEYGGSYSDVEIVNCERAMKMVIKTAG